MFTQERFQQFPAVAILRGITAEQIPVLAQVIMESELPAVEITMNTDGAEDLIAGLREQLPGWIAVGAGTVLSLTAMENALKAGAEFIVMPTIERDICDYCRVNDIPFFPGALTPNEVWEAWKMGATMVKVFPVQYLGPSYIKELKGPLDAVKLLACGGVNQRNVAEYRKNGADAFAIGGSTIPLNKLNENDYTAIVEGVKAMKRKWNDG